MNTSKKSPSLKKQSNAQALESAGPVAPKAKAIKRGVDVHVDLYVAVRIADGGAPQPPQGFRPEEFVLWCAKQLTLAERVYTCYEAGPFGYGLRRRLEKMGVPDYVVRPRDWDQYGLGKLTREILEREVTDWNRFKNRRQVASYTGRCPGEDSSGERRFQGSINKHGNRRVASPRATVSFGCGNITSTLNTQKGFNYGKTQTREK